MAARFGRVIYWTSFVVAVLFELFGWVAVWANGSLSALWSHDSYAGIANTVPEPFGSTDADLGWLMLVTATVLGLVVWGAGRACRYVLAGE